MKNPIHPFTFFIVLTIVAAIPGCILSGGLTHDGKGTVATLGFSHEFKPRFRADAKRVKPLE